MLGVGAGPRESCRASLIWVTSLGDSGWSVVLGLWLLGSGAGLGLGAGGCLGHLPRPLSARMLAAVMRSLVVALSSMPWAMSCRISMSSRPLLVSSSMALAKSSAGLDGICWAGWFIVFWGLGFRWLVALMYCE